MTFPTTTQNIYDEIIAARDAAEAWAEGTEPGGAGTKSAKEWADAADASSALASEAGAAQVALAAAQVALAEAAASEAMSISRVAPTWADLMALTGTVDGEGARVLDADTGSHSNATATGYDGDTVANAGVYAWNDAWSRWVWVSGSDGTVSDVSYENEGGSGERTAFWAVMAPDAVIGNDGDLANLVNGDDTADTANAVRFAIQDMTGVRIIFAAPAFSSKVIQEVTWKTNSALSLWDAKWQGSNDGKAWEDVSDTFTMGGTENVVTLDNAKGFSYYGLLGVSGSSVSASIWHTEVTFKIVGDQLDGRNAPVSSILHDGFPTDVLLHFWRFDEEGGDTVYDYHGVSHIDLANPAVTDPNATRNRQGVKLANGLIQTPVIEGAQEVVILYRTGLDQSGGFMISGGDRPTGALTQDTYAANDTARIAGMGWGVRAPIGRINSSTVQGVQEFNRGLWTVAFRSYPLAYDTIFGFGGRHSDTTSRCGDFEIASAMVFNRALTDAERGEVYKLLRKEALAKGITLDNQDVTTKARTTVILGESTGDGRGLITEFPSQLQTTNLSPFMQIMSGGEGRLRNQRFSGLVVGINHKVDSTATYGGIEEGAGLEMALAGEYIAALNGPDQVPPHILKYAIGGTHLAPSATGSPVTGGETWNVDELATSSIFADAMAHFTRAFGLMVQDGIGWGSVKVAIYLGINDSRSADANDAPDVATYQAWAQDFLDGIKARFPGIDAEFVWFRPPPTIGDNATNRGVVRDALALLDAANTDLTVIDTDGDTLNADGIHYDADSYLTHAATVMA